MTPAHATTSVASASLLRDLALVLPESSAVQWTPETPGVLARGQAIDAADGLRRAVELIDASVAPAIAGIEHLSVEAIRAAVELADRMRGKLFLGRLGAATRAARRPATMTATLAHVFACDLILWVGCNGDTGPVARAIASRQLRAAFLEADLATALRLRALFTANPHAEPIGAFKRVAAVLAADCEPRVASQWHALAAHLQHEVRFCVFQLPADDAPNRRGAIEVVAWQTGLSLEAVGGVDFGASAPRACTDLPSHVARNGIDLLIDCGSGPAGDKAPRRIAVGPTVDPHAELCFATPGLVPGLAARVMRSDGVVLWLCDDPAAAVPDPATGLFAQLGAAIRRAS